MLIKNIYQLLSLCSIVSFAMNSYCAQVDAPYGPITKVEDLCKRIFAVQNPSAYEKLGLLTEIHKLNEQESIKLEDTFRNMEPVNFSAENSKLKTRIQNLNLRFIKHHAPLYDFTEINHSQVEDGSYEINYSLDANNEIYVFTNQGGIVSRKTYLYQREMQSITKPFIKIYQYQLDTKIPTENAFPAWISDPLHIKNLSWVLIDLKNRTFDDNRIAKYKAFQKALYSALGKESPCDPIKDRPHLKAWLSPKSKSLSFATQWQSKKALFQGNQTSLAFRPQDMALIDFKYNRRSPLDEKIANTF